jgi:hypothetical protein
MDGVSWIDLDPDEQRAIALLGAGVSVELCDRVALLTLARLGLVRGGQLTPAAGQLRRAAILHELRRKRIGQLRRTAIADRKTLPHTPPRYQAGALCETRTMSEITMPAQRSTQHRR